jgi:putative membrane protein
MATDLRDDPRVYMAAERTFLAWIRTGLALMGFGFVVARFGLFLREFTEHEGGQKFTSTGFSIAVGVGLVLVGVFVDIGSTVHHVRLTRQLSSGRIVPGAPRSLPSRSRFFSRWSASRWRSTWSSSADAITGYD